MIPDVMIFYIIIGLVIVIVAIKLKSYLTKETESEEMSLYGMLKKMTHHDRYEHIIAFLDERITPGSEYSVESQLLNLEESIKPKELRKPYRKFVESGVWKKYFVKKW